MDAVVLGADAMGEGEGEGGELHDADEAGRVGGIFWKVPPGHRFVRSEERRVGKECSW